MALILVVVGEAAMQNQEEVNLGPLLLVLEKNSALGATDRTKVVLSKAR